MDFFKAAERLMTMDDATWEHHANPLSVYTRFTILPLLSLAIWSRVWLGWWCLIPIALTIVWTWYNPRAFGKPLSTKNWASRVTLGERHYLNRKSHPIPAHHNGILTATHVLSVIGLIALTYGLIVLNLWATIFGVSIIMIAKTWFCDRMVWLYMETHPDG
ncbi:hypothetical protein F9L33_10170 [Amylibacter sp. SFDW26]|uniref:DUF6653 family protein n=1 Tax=Amylibacter sp. SFDW26 TaxID=2652722 RepID=UPI00126271BB|nr:DUF6653 family protein [Amylibacter sp. SFDW26]KAB7613730.1 hypothetical protein F9L33_10170 [Amylibacter sp. SFDW26]